MKRGVKIAGGVCHSAQNFSKKHVYGPAFHFYSDLELNVETPFAVNIVTKTLYFKCVFVVYLKLCCSYKKVILIAPHTLFFDLYHMFSTL